jgi:hypothetical protein
MKMSFALFLKDISVHRVCGGSVGGEIDGDTRENVSNPEHDPRRYRQLLLPGKKSANNVYPRCLLACHIGLVLYMNIGLLI